MSIFANIIARAEETENAEQCRKAEEKARQVQQENAKVRATLDDFLQRIGVEKRPEVTSHPRHEFSWAVKNTSVAPYSDVQTVTLEGVTFAAAMLSLSIQSIVPQVYAVAKCDHCGHRVWSKMLWSSDFASYTNLTYHWGKTEKVIASVIKETADVWGSDSPTNGSDYTFAENRHADSCMKYAWQMTDSRSGARLALNARTEEEARNETLRRLGYTLHRGPTA
jgi:hypothetical protein